MILSAYWTAWLIFTGLNGLLLFATVRTYIATRRLIQAWEASR